MKNTLIITLCLIFSLANEVQAGEEQQLANEPANNKLSLLKKKQWNHGAEDCTTNKDQAIELYQYDESSYILRQNKCLSYEAPFIYVLIGTEKILVVDTGTTDSAEEFPLYQMIMSLKQKHSDNDKTNDREILVIHSHSHSDHYGGDAQFTEQQNIKVVSANSAALQEFFTFKEWPKQYVNLDLGGRSLTVIPTPGHQEEAISIYDPQTEWLLTGDTFYPGYIYVKDWNEYKNSIARLLSFTNKHTVSAILGAHIEMTNRAGEYYDIGTIYQPNEAPLPLMPTDLTTLHTKLSLAEKPGKVSLDGMIVEPLGALPKLISNIVKWFI